MSVVDKAAPATVAHRSSLMEGRSLWAKAFWWVASVGMFVGVWEFCWAMGWADPRLLPPPHVFLGDLRGVFRLYDRTIRMGNPPNWMIVLVVLKVIALSTMRVLAGLVIAFVVSLAVGMAIRYSRLFGRLTLPTINLLSPVSPVAWMPVAIAVFGLGNAPAIFLVYIALFFIMTLATLSLIDNVPLSYVQVARIMGANRRQIFLRVVLPAILPGLFLVLRLNVFAAWVIVLIAEATGSESGLGLVIGVARSTFNNKLAFVSMLVVGILGFMLEAILRLVQNRVLYWVPKGQAALKR